MDRCYSLTAEGGSSVFFIFTMKMIRHCCQIGSLALLDLANCRQQLTVVLVRLAQKPFPGHAGLWGSQHTSLQLCVSVHLCATLDVHGYVQWNKMNRITRRWIYGGAEKCWAGTVSLTVQLTDGCYPTGKKCFSLYALHAYKQLPPWSFFLSSILLNKSSNI